MARGGRREGAGRPQGSQSVRPTIRRAFEEAFAAMQAGAQSLPKWAEGNPTEFYKLAVRLIPTTIEAMTVKHEIMANAAAFDEIPVDELEKMTALLSRLVFRRPAPERVN